MKPAELSKLGQELPDLREDKVDYLNMYEFEFINSEGPNKYKYRMHLEGITHTKRIYLLDDVFYALFSVNTYGWLDDRYTYLNIEASAKPEDSDVRYHLRESITPEVLQNATELVKETDHTIHLIGSLEDLKEYLK